MRARCNDCHPSHQSLLPACIFDDLVPSVECTTAPLGKGTSTTTTSISLLVDCLCFAVCSSPLCLQDVVCVHNESISSLCLCPYFTSNCSCDRYRFCFITTTMYILVCVFFFSVYIVTSSSHDSMHFSGRWRERLRSLSLSIALLLPIFSGVCCFDLIWNFLDFAVWKMLSEWRRWKCPALGT